MIPSYVVQASPLSKLFMSTWTSRCEENPELVFSSDPFIVTIPKTNGALQLTHNKPVHITKLEPHNPNRVRDEYLVDDLDGMVMWLIGGEDGQRSEETDIYGVVGLNIDMDLSSALSDVALFDAEDPKEKDKAQKKYLDVQKALVAKTKIALTEATELANSRVRRAMKNTHVNLMRQYDTMRTEGKGVYAASVAEAIGAYVLANEIEKSSTNSKKMQDLLASAMNGNMLR